MIICKNCQTHFEGKFCNQCGQPSDTQKIDHKYIGTELQKTFIRLDAGFLYTTKYLFKNPGKAISTYIEGKRIHHIRPFSYILILAGIYLIIYNQLQLHLFDFSIDGRDKAETNTKLIRYYTQIQFSLLIVYTFFSMLIFNVKKYNIYEYIVVHCYLTAQRILIATFSLPILYFFKGPLTLSLVTAFFYLVGLVYLAWTFITLFKESSKWIVILKILIMQILIFISSGSLLYLISKYF